MRYQQQRMTFQFGSGLTRLGKKLLIIYAAIYVIELICEHWLHIPMVSNLKVYPVSHPYFRTWQVFTHPFIHDPANPIGFLINCLVFYFFSAPVERVCGTIGYLKLFYLSALGGLVLGLLFANIAGFNIPFLGMMPSILALVVIFGLVNPESTILLMFILPVKAKYISYGTILITGLTFLAKANPYGAYHLGGILFGYLYFKFPHVFNPNILYLFYLQWKLKRAKSKFKVIDGGSKNDEDKPTLH